MATLQRLGYILEFILEEQEKADELYAHINASSPRWKSILLSNAAPANGEDSANRWHVNKNIEIEIDEL